MYPCTKFKLFQRTQVLGPNLPPPKNMNDRNFEKINVEVVISI